MKEASGSILTHVRSDSRVPLLPYADSSLSSSPSARSLSKRYMTYIPKRRSFVALLSLTVLSLVAFSFTFLGRSANALLPVPGYTTAVPPSSDANPSSVPGDAATEHDSEPEISTPYPDEFDDELAHSPYLLGPPTASFRDNLRTDTKYITSWISAGWTNDVMTYANLIYLGSLTDRVPIVAMFTPSHIGGDAAPIPFGEVFDVPRFNRESGIPIVEWDEVKDPESDVLDDLGCWNIWEAVQLNEHHPRYSAVPDWLKLDLSYTKAPGWVKQIPDYPHDLCSTFPSLTRLGFPQERAKNLGNSIPSPQHNVSLDPDDHLLCFDYLYYACSQQSYEYDYDYAPQWRKVLRYFRWTRRIDMMAALYVKQIFGLELEAELPPYIAVHVRHGDFKNWCWQAENPDDCFAPLSVIARRVREVQEELRARKGVEVPMDRVVITSDESDPAWWDEVKALGWKTVDHQAARTAEVLGRWYPVILDAAIQSNAMGFVGTDRSTYSILSRRRVETWHDGVTRTVLWGYKGADDH
ncbi:hypothetical protein K466DRAFT_583411 [Polyporus arcularius HHB13444]|uniref:GDP-fucose protein O-fucosyltransferase 2 n=1 Tax=Polyporus arcularius HHB13444 TaxID=1314778 RepID=A0A5C3PP10_9APHY|nr:hypothetical protein K466DRAFT_583411 [Polyporus arcularius HHB13444]